MKPTVSGEADAAFQQLAAVHLALGASATFGAAAQADAQSQAKSSGQAKRNRSQVRKRLSAQVVLVQDSRGVLRWDYRTSDIYERSGAAPGQRRASGMARSRYRGISTVGNVLASAEVAEIGPNEITSALQRLDARLTPHQGLRMWADRAFSRIVDTNPKLQECNRLLLLVHGTFSSGEMYAEQLDESFFAAARKRYSHIAAFDHPTLCVSPMLNAIDLENALVEMGLPTKTPVDVICHSRGGLVASWWIRSTRFQVERLVAVASPLLGTSLASPYRIRYLLDYLANLSRLLGHGLQGAAAFPSFASGFLAGAGGLMGILGGFSGALSAVPLADAGIALVPGLHGQARVTNNAELTRLWGGPPITPPEFYFVSSDFEAASNAPWWNLVAQLKQMPWVAADGFTDRLFPSKNDLVVDTECMTGGFPVADSLVFKGEDAVHHCAYFQNGRTVKSLRRWLKF
jgi:pimeloyl-ACP methyl ester carboxylesterase